MLDPAEDGPPPLDDEDGPPPLEDAPPKPTNSSLLDLEERVEEERGAIDSESTPAHDALIARLIPKPKPRKQAETSGDAAPAKFEAGDTVEVFGLQGAPQHNGKQGVVQRFDETKGRYVLRIPATKKPLAVKPANLRLSKPLAKGFLDTPAARRPSQGGEARAQEEEDVIEFVTPKFKEREEESSLRLDEVQQALGAAQAKQKEWMNAEFMERFSKNPRLMAGFSDPRCQQAMQEMQDNPSEVRPQPKRPLAGYEPNARASG